MVLIIIMFVVVLVLLYHFAKITLIRKFHFHIISSIISKNNLTKLQKLAQQYNINISISIIDNTYFDNLPTQKTFPISMYFNSYYQLLILIYLKFFI